MPIELADCAHEAITSETVRFTLLDPKNHHAHLGFCVIFAG